MWADTTAYFFWIDNMHMCCIEKNARYCSRDQLLDSFSFQVTYPLDVLRLRLAVDPASQSMGQVNI